MNRIVKNDFLSDTEYEYYPKKNQMSGADRISILFKHDYYSSDSEHGRLLLQHFVEAILQSDKEINAIFFTDSSVKLLSEYNDLYYIISSLIAKSENTIVCKESCIEYNISPESDLYIVSDSESFFEDLIQTEIDFILE